MSETPAARFREMPLEELVLNPFKKIGNEWMLITAGDKDKFNMMTASWGGMGVLWHKEVCFIFVKPTRYTFQFIEKKDFFSLTFFSSKYRTALMTCGSVSGRDTEKAKASGLTPLFDREAPYFSEASLVFICRKIAYADMEPGGFLDASIHDNYDGKDYHRLYVGEIIACLEQK